MDRFNFLEKIILRKLLQKIHLSYSNLEKLFCYCYEIKRREQIALRKILRTCNCQQILHNDKLNRAQKGEQLLKNIFQKRFPLTSRLIK